MRHRSAEPGVGSQGLGIELATGLMQVELLFAESQRHATVAEALPTHVQPGTLDASLTNAACRSVALDGERLATSSRSPERTFH